MGYMKTVSTWSCLTNLWCGGVVVSKEVVMQSHGDASTLIRHLDTDILLTLHDQDVDRGQSSISGVLYRGTERILGVHLVSDRAKLYTPYILHISIIKGKSQDLIIRPIASALRQWCEHQQRARGPGYFFHLRPSHPEVTPLVSARVFNTFKKQWVIKLNYQSMTLSIT